VRLSDVICRREKFGYPGDSLIPRMTEELWERLDINQKSINSVIESSEKEIEKAGVLLELTK